MILKDYQQQTLATLRRFLETCRIAGPAGAYGAITGEEEQKARLGNYADRYQPLEVLPEVPYACLRLPTGGGKTILAAHAVATARDSWIEKDFPLVLWLVPTNTIRLQTSDALKNRRHPYRQALDDGFEGRVRVFDIAEFTHIRPHDIGNNLCLVIGTIQTLRISNTEGRKVYAHHEDMESHYSAVPPTAPGLEIAETGPHKGWVKYSFANLLHIHRPLIIMDEAHKAGTKLTGEMYRRINPCAVIEFTATPRPNSNILYNVTAQELKSEEMVKLPILLSGHDSWQGAVNGAVAERAALAEKAKSDRGYIRPIVLFQAQQKGLEVTVEVLKQHLMETEQIPEERIAIATGDQRELDSIDLFDPKCPIEYIITKEALREGWDCSFAYVFCSVANVKSAGDVEQLLGRVMRMPYAERRGVPELNLAYAHVSALSFRETALALLDKLVKMGFDEEEAKEQIRPGQLPLGLEDTDDLFGPKVKEPEFEYRVEVGPDDLTALEERARGEEGIRIRKATDGKADIRVTGPVSPKTEREILELLPEPERPGFREKMQKHRETVAAVLSPARQGKRFTVPRLMAQVQGELVFADADAFMENIMSAPDWSLLNRPARLEKDQFDIRETAQHFEIDLDGNRLQYRFVGETENQTLDLDTPAENWTPERLAGWLSGQVRQNDIDPMDLLRWSRELIEYLTDTRKISIVALWRCKYILANKIREMFDGFREEERGKAYQQCLFAPEARVEVSFDEGFEFRDGMFQGGLGYGGRYRGNFRFQKHFLGADSMPAFDGKQDGEEFQCAEILDSLPEVKYWVRNVARHSNAFWLPTATDRFYPDFVAQLADDRLLVAEYKGKHLMDTPDTRKKKTIGELWERQSGGKGLFALVTKQDERRGDMRRQIVSKVGE
uniref:Type III restriction enzyme n=1 Tax=Candidatus Kentrum sp. DK TaxID=2126562 RepID=A0A450SA05_9GAMM|nr:MAG: type III restriction enzyme [Candidatus Kentron sp. DK]